MTPRTMLICAALLNAVILVMEVIGFRMSLKKYGFGIFKNYTEDSNLIALFTSLIFIISAIATIADGSYAVSTWVRVIRLIATTMLTVTFIVVITVLAPSEKPDGYRKFLFKGAMLYHHLLCPLVSLISFLIFEGTPKLGSGTSFVVLIPTMVYGVIALTMNINRKWDGPYPFLRVHKQSVAASIIWMSVIVILAWAAGLGIWKLSELIAG